MIKDKLKGFIAGVIVTTVTLTGIVAFSMVREQTFTALFKDINIYLFGEELIPTDVNGKVVEPFVVDGTTYLPVRALCNAFGFDVEWDGDTNSIFLSYEDGYDGPDYGGSDFFNIFETAGVDSDLSFIRIGSTIDNYVELIFDRITGGHNYEYSWVGITANIAMPQDMIVIEQWFSDVNGSVVTYLYYREPSDAGEYAEPDGSLVITLLENGNIQVEQYGDIGIEDETSLDGEYAFVRVG